MSVIVCFFQLPSASLPLAILTKGRHPLGEAWLRVGAFIAEFNMDGYGVARWLSASSARQRLSAY